MGVKFLAKGNNSSRMPQWDLAITRQMPWHSARLHYITHCCVWRGYFWRQSQSLFILFRNCYEKWWKHQLSIYWLQFSSNLMVEMLIKRTAANSLLVPSTRTPHDISGWTLQGTIVQHQNSDRIHKKIPYTDEIIVSLSAANFSSCWPNRMQLTHAQLSHQIHSLLQNVDVANWLWQYFQVYGNSNHWSILHRKC